MINEMTGRVSWLLVFPYMAVRSARHTLDHPDQTPCDPLQPQRLIVITLEPGAFHFDASLPHGLL
jgi:hypothetical protein